MITVEIGLLDVALFDEGPRIGPPVMLLHGWPDDATTWSGVARRLNEAGFRTVAPFLRGFGPTRFRDGATPRAGNSATLALDALALADALGFERFFVAGHDWGSNAAEAMAVAAPARIRRLAMIATPSRLGGSQTPSFAQAQRQWYHWFQATKRGEEAVRRDPIGFGRIMWENWSPAGWFDEATFAVVARSWENPDWVDVTLHSYRARWDEAEPDPRSADLDRLIKATERIDTPTLYIGGAVDGVNPPETAEAMPGKFSGPFRTEMLPGIGHFPPREAPEVVADLLAAHFGEDRGGSRSAGQAAGATDPV